MVEMDFLEVLASVDNATIGHSFVNGSAMLGILQERGIWDRAHQRWRWRCSMKFCELQRTCDAKSFYWRHRQSYEEPTSKDDWGTCKGRVGVREEHGGVRRLHDL